uniref:Uncharacterized protein n=1 Tax=Arundo donax TaxID=35708 RepID=A0A0A9B6V4_ARUDO
MLAQMLFRLFISHLMCQSMTMVMQLGSQRHP